MSEVIAAIIGALVGTAITSMFATGQYRRQKEYDARWQYAAEIAQLLGAVLSPYTPDSESAAVDAWKLREEWGILARKLHVLGCPVRGDGSDPLSKTVTEYLEALRSFRGGEMPRAELEQKRQNAKDVATEYLARLRMGRS